ncbi:secreted protein [Candidatus Magnetomorum sp. HK-1]|nr:secreted protein [Candidatus Magnetomorum sp. HK-1]
MKKAALSIIFALTCMVSICFSNENNIRDAIYGQPFSNQELQSFDFNSDSKVDISDLIYYLNHNLKLSGHTCTLTAKQSGIDSFIISIAQSIDKNATISWLGQQGFTEISDIEPDFFMIRKYFPCSDIYIIENNTIKFHYSGYLKCHQGTVTQEKYAVVMDKLNTKDSQVANGIINITMNYGSEIISMTATGQSISISDTTYSGEIKATYHKNTGEIVAESNQFVFSGNNNHGSVNQMTLSMNSSDQFNGVLDLIHNDTAIKGTVSNIKIDPVCKIDVLEHKQLPVPTGGIINVNGITCDFTNTSCGHLFVNVQIGLFTIQMALSDFYQLFLEKDMAINGAATVWIKGERLDCQFYNVRFDHSCGIFNSGKVDITKVFKKSFFGITLEEEVVANLDFSKTTCSNKNINCSIFGLGYPLNWDTIKDLEIPIP